MRGIVSSSFSHRACGQADLHQATSPLASPRQPRGSVSRVCRAESPGSRLGSNEGARKMLVSGQKLRDDHVELLAELVGGELGDRLRQAVEQKDSFVALSLAECEELLASRMRPGRFSDCVRR